LSEIQLAVFEGTNSQFRSYLHQSRYELQRHIPGLSLPYDRDSRTYRIETNNLHLRWDAQELLRTLSELNHSDLLEKLEDYKGPFLNALDTPWTEEVRTKTEIQLGRQGIVILKQLHAQGRYEMCLQLAERLLNIDPFLPEVIEIQIRATSDCHGQEPGKRLQSEIIRQLKTQFGGIPEDFQRLLVAKA
jgi:two-component SAPR family response regulator